MAKVKCSKRVVIGTVKEPVRFSYANVLEPRENLNGVLEYSVSVLIPKTYESILALIEDTIAEVKELGKVNLWGGRIPKFKYEILHDGDEEKADQPEYAGMYFINAKATLDHAPEVLDEKRRKITDPNEFGSGDYGCVSIEFVAYDNTKAMVKGIKPGLGNIMRLKKGDRFGGGRSAAADFGEPEEGDLD